MRWSRKTYKEGSTKTFNKFLLFPRCVRNKCYWLTTVRVTYEYTAIASYEDGFVFKDYAWVLVKIGEIK